MASDAIAHVQEVLDDYQRQLEEAHAQIAERDQRLAQIHQLTTPPDAPGDEPTGDEQPQE